MSSGKIIAKLSIKAAKTDASPSKSAPSKNTGTSWEDVSGALAFIKNPLGGEVLKTKWANDKTSLNSLMASLKTILEDEAQFYCWEEPTPGTYERMVVMALRECEIVKIENGTIVPGVEKCGRCKGRGTSVHGEKLAVRDCPNCHDGEIKWYWRRARDIGLHRNVFRRVWEQRYMFIIKIILQAILDADIAVRRQLKECAPEN